MNVTSPLLLYALDDTVTYMYITYTQHVHMYTITCVYSCTTCMYMYKYDGLLAYFLHACYMYNNYNVHHTCIYVL